MTKRNASGENCSASTQATSACGRPCTVSSQEKTAALATMMRICPLR